MNERQDDSQYENEMSAPDAAPAPPATVVIEPAKPARGNRLFWGLLSGCLLLFVLMTIVTAVVAVVGRDTGGAPTAWIGGDRVAILPIDGEIFNARDTIERLHSYRDNRNIKAIVVRINTPGGAIVPSQEIFEEIRKVRRETEKPVVASLDNVAASGGYYIAVACDRIVSNRGTITGSIGVIAQWFNLEDLVEWARMRPQTFKSGDLKDVGSPFREMTESEQAYFQEIVAQLHSQFVAAVISGREGIMTEAEVRAVSDGRVVTGEQAHQLKLVDDLGDLYDAVDIAGEMAGIRGKPKVIYPRERGPRLIDLLAGNSDADALLRYLSRGRLAPFLYRWQ